MRSQHSIVSAPKLVPGDRVAILSPSFAAPAVAPEIHEQAMRRLAEATGLVPVEYPTTRELDATARARADDLNAAFADPSIRAILATIGGDDQVTVISHLDAELARADPKIFLGYSDNTNLLNWLWSNGVAGYYGGSTQVHLGAGPGVDDAQLASLRAALMTGGILPIIEPGESEDFGQQWQSPLALTEFGAREPTEPWTWSGPEVEVEGPTWGGCIEVLDQIAMAGRMPGPDELEGAILLIETSEELPPATAVQRWMRSLGERGVLAAVAGVLVARPPSSNFETMPTADGRAAFRAEQRAAVLAELAVYNPDAVVCIGVPFGHTRPQWILPHGGRARLDGRTKTVAANYD